MCVHACVHARARVCVHVFLHTCVCVYIRVSACVSVVRSLFVVLCMYNVLTWVEIVVHSHVQ